MERSKNYKISIIIPTYNRSWSIERAVNSVLKQTNQDWELIIVDDGSTDDTRLKLLSYLEKDSRIRYFYKENGGVGSARNYGAKKAGNEYITFLDSDDELTSDALEVMRGDLPLFNNYDVKLILYLVKKYNKVGSESDEVKDLSIIDYKAAIEGKWPRIDTAQLLRKEVFKNNSFPELSGGLEAIFWFGLLKNGATALLRNRILYTYHTEHNSRLTGTGQLMKRAITMPELYKIFLGEFELDYIQYNRKKLAYFYIEKAIFEIILGSVIEGRCDLKAAVKYNAKKRIIIYLIYLFSFLPNNLFIKLAVLGHLFKKIIK